MDWFVKAFIKSSVAWLAVGITLGVAMALHPVWTIYRPAHMHMNLAGFVAMMIFGVAYHVVPRFTGNRLHSSRAAGMHWFASNIGLALMVCGFALRANGLAFGEFLLAAGGIATAVGGYTFGYVIWRTVEGKRVPAAPLASRSAVASPARSGLPLVG
jgi:cbb3-type cytochrome oxidase subunit 1